MNQPNTYLDNQLKEKLKALRTYESETYAKWGNRKRIFKMVGVDFEIKFCRAEMILKESLRQETTQRKISRVEMMNRAFEQLNIKLESSGYPQIQPNVRSFRFDNKNILVCDTDEEKPLLIKIHKQEEDVAIFSIEELLRCIPKDLMEAKQLLSKLSKEVNFVRIKHEEQKSKQSR
tara:strand:+ start:36 stop:563 length:528 start_codon:yes stop_codon:yes gene_type:complete